MRECDGSCGPGCANCDIEQAARERKPSPSAEGMAEYLCPAMLCWTTDEVRAAAKASRDDFSGTGVFVVIELCEALDASRAREASLKAALAKAEGERDRSIIEERDTAETMVKVEDRAIAAEARASEAEGLLRELRSSHPGVDLFARIDALLAREGKGER